MDILGLIGTALITFVAYLCMCYAIGSNSKVVNIIYIMSLCVLVVMIAFFSWPVAILDITLMIQTILCIACHFLASIYSVYWMHTKTKQ